MEAPMKDLNYMLSFAAAQCTHHEEAWRRYAQIARIKDFVIASVLSKARAGTCELLLKLQRGL